MTLFTGFLEIPFSPYSIPMKVSWLSFQIVRRSSCCRVFASPAWLSGLQIVEYYYYCLLGMVWGRKVIPVSVDPRKGVYGYGICW